MPGEPQQDSSRVIPEKRTWETNMQFIVGLVAAVGVELLKVLIDELRKRAERKREAKALKVHESCTKEDLQELIQQMKAMFEDLQKLQEPRKTEKGNTPKAQGSRMEETLQQLCQEMKAVREDLQKGQESRKTEEGNTPKAQGSRMEETLQQLYQEMKAVHEDLQKGQESAKQDIQLLREDLNKEMDRKIEKMARAQESKMDEGIPAVLSKNSRSGT
ncbi:uncharacterized protein LOC126647773 isoform X2 [Myiozetetes cayanensis]|uniref:uncharacterized protein LOC126647773 isoform X2 n=1 Tax=Myiozetetes cayanensis TaxID=478635 RepID=UPI00215E722E|nr:uncharacterized protein LOC126647773 isoform X2 [Myiozetetes cayanensis]